MLLLLLLMLFGSCAVSESNSFDKHFITCHGCCSCTEKIKDRLVFCVARWFDVASLSK